MHIPIVHHMAIRGARNGQRMEPNLLRQRWLARSGQIDPALSRSVVLGVSLAIASRQISRRGWEAVFVAGDR